MLTFTSGCSISTELFKSVTDLMSRQPLQAVLSSSVSSYNNLSQWTVQVTFSEDVQGLEVSDFSVNNATIVSLTPVDASTYDLVLEPLLDGPVTVLLPVNAATSLALNEATPESNTLSFTSDRTKPSATLTYSGDDPTNESPLIFDLMLGESVASVLDASAFAVTNGIIDKIEGSGPGYFIYVIPSASQTEVRLSLPGDRIYDLAGNGNLASAEMVVEYNSDRPLPTLSSADPMKVNVAAISVAVSFSAPVTGFDASDLELSNATVENFAGSGDTYTFTLRASGQGDFAVRVKNEAASDSVGNKSLVSSWLNRHHDSVRPTVSLGSLAAYTLSAPVSITATFSESVSGFTAGDLELVNATATVTGSGGSYTIEITPVTEGAFSVRVPEAAATDDAGNASQASATSSSIFDTLPPTVEIISEAGPNVYEAPIYFTIKFSEEVTGLVAADFVKSGANISSVTPASGPSAVYRLQMAAPAFGTGDISLSLPSGVVVDGSGKGNLASAVTTVLFDNSPVTISLAGNEQVVTEDENNAGGSPDKLFGLTMSGSKPYNVTVNYEVSGSAVANTDVTLAQKGSILIPAGSTNVSLPFRLINNAGSIHNKYLQLNLTFANTPVARFARVSQSRVMIKDVTSAAHSTVKRIVGSYRHRCALMMDGKVRCWGENADGQLGDGTTANRLQAVSALTGVWNFKQLTTGADHSCGILDDPAKEVVCWGNNDRYQLGLGDQTDRHTPVLLSSISGVDEIAAGDGFTCALKAGKIYCWGRQDRGRLGNGVVTNGNVSTPAELVTASAFDFDRLSVGGGTGCAINTNNQLYCWGNNGRGQLGIGSTAHQGTAQLVGSDFLKISVAGLTVPGTIAAEGGHVCAVKTDFTVQCWGGNSYLQSGSSPTTDKTLPATITSVDTFDDVAAGAYHTCGIRKSDGRVVCWGSTRLGGNTNYIGPHGQGLTPGTTVLPVLTADTNSYASITSGVAYSCGVTSTGRTKCWGEYGAGYLGDGSSVYRREPAVSDIGVTYKKISMGVFLSCGITTDDILKCWGANQFSTYLGDGSSFGRSYPVVIDQERKYKDVAIGYESICGILLDGTLKCWGGSGSYGVGDGVLQIRLSPVVIDGGTSYKWISVGQSTTCGVTSAGVLKCWGRNNSGIIGGSTTPAVYAAPTVIDSGVRYKMVSVLGGLTGSACAITDENELKCWGNHVASLGRGAIAAPDIYTPGVVMAGTKFVAVSMYGSRTCAISDAFKLYCWGDGTGYGTGLNVTTSYNTPQMVSPAVSYTSVSMGSNGGCAITTGEQIKCWGAEGDVATDSYWASTGTGLAEARIPADLLGGGTYKSVERGGNSGCAITPTDALKCWGSNVYGQMADYKVLMSWLTPIDITNWIED
ncbi:Ig-like domain-containing protein [Bdellovibrio bacteriovorus]|uniref:RTX family exoprotein n=1 Tax=Bdellovibrio bacteriovorus str. Tiberius TaxID=1069642 RepID=K7YZ80_BDEBC|nr:Ig-like domain-containing protein [Bdellovibrio bacteriovorus]AFY03053.1 RTX family exoprotein [Bdellovibrio bacteriovorus str. Tiberius]